jgi:redox-sensitive bicupin YhaK (pirin superfamily)
MTAGRGIIHSEMPQQEEGRMSGFQLWVNLPAAEKMKNPSYRDIPSADIPVQEHDGVSYKVVAGDIVVNGATVTGAVSGITTNPLYVDIRFGAEKTIELPLPDGHTALVFVYAGEASVGEQHALTAGQVAVLSKDGAVVIHAKPEARLLVLAGKPLNEPIAQYGPFVMNTPDEIEQAIQDYRDGTLTEPAA